jgi:hypothetical protein
MVPTDTLLVPGRDTVLYSSATNAPSSGVQATNSVLLLPADINDMNWVQCARGLPLLSANSLSAAAVEQFSAQPTFVAASGERGSGKTEVFSATRNGAYLHGPAIRLHTHHGTNPSSRKQVPWPWDKALKL